MRYRLIEQSLSLRERIRNTLARHIESGKASVHEEETTSSAPTIFFANEFFDAVPVEILTSNGSLRIDTREGRFIETWTKPSTDELEFLDRYSVHPERGERIEATLAAQQFMNRIAAKFDEGFFIALDYGYT